MADITKCASASCEWEASCYRKLVPDSGLQSYEDFTARPPGENGWLYWDDIAMKYLCKFYINERKVAT